ncbi:tyrosine-type recombinase/integrase [Geodermatophilus sabuli]|uniref:Site-specific recombinase XerD n=1 Tax=Geodermatophilus sabuli TaxID=1564158 RepID=A0A285EDI9_9ACTN|nr:site-specific integrase [Geodermatophilus sabuli]MBB3084717.1 integrase [Geodermatophilus sabuli]SNX97095.1 Site-specific recombinase XerD [Geodermatophilus sabuli]
MSPRARTSSSARRRGNSEGSAPRRRPDGRWQINLRVTDEAGKASRHTVYGDTAQDARDKAAEIRKRVEGGHPARDRRETVAAFTLHWIDTALQASERKRNTKIMYAGVARTHILGSSLADLTLDRVRPSHVEGWIVGLRRKGLAESSIRSAYTILRAILDTAVRDGALATNPAGAIRRPRVTVREAPHLTPAQVGELLRAAEGSRYAGLFAFLVHTGLRRGEALALRWADVDFANNLLRVRGTLARIDGELLVTEPKTAKSKRFVPLSEPAGQLLHDQQIAQAEERRLAGSAWRQTGFVFTTEFGEPCEPRNAFRALRVAAARAGLPHAGLHTLRHSAASVMLSRGVPLKVVSEILGHSSIAITGDIYGHVSPDVARRAMDTLGDAFDR